MTRRFLLVALLVAAISGVLPYPGSPALADNWPQWRGPKGDGQSAEKGLPTEWGPDKNVVWKLPMPGHGSSTPCLWDDRIFLTSADGDNIVLLCAGTDGKEKWKQKLTGTGKTLYKGGEANDASASCITDGKHVWSFVGNGALLCHDFDGKQVWEKNIQDYGKFSIQFGIHWTPVLYKDRLYLQVMHRGAQKVVCFDASSGKEIWAVQRSGYSKGESPDTYASASMWEGEGGPLLIAHGNDYCTAHKLEDGAEVWRVAGLNPTSRGDWRFVSCPGISPDLIVVPSCKNGPTVALNPVGAKGTIDPQNKTELWRINLTPDVVAPLRVGDVVYLLNGDQGQKFTAVEAKTGKQLYQQALGAKQIYRGNMVAGDGKVYIVGREGIALVLQAGKEYQLLATNELKEPVYASPAIANGRLYIRTWNNLYCIGK